MENIIKMRKSVRKFDPNYKISNEKVLEMINLAQRAPSSNNLQPWRFVVVSSNEAKEKINDLFTNNRSQFETSSQLIFVFGNKNLYNDGILISKEALENNVISKEVSENQINSYQKLATFEVTNNLYNSIFFDLGLVVMNLMLIIKDNGFDSSPIGGFNKNKINKALNLDDNYIPCMVLAIGKESKDNISFDTYRLDAKKTTIIL